MELVSLTAKRSLFFSKMCEWLSCGDWCDVRLICGGRFFNAHRVVLASVSSFLRRMLLSCPVDESPVYIFLPEFDFDTMSSILYYIYNGEVLIPNHKLTMFLDTANVMEIFIDQQCIPQTNDYKHNCSVLRSGNKVFAIENYNICQLRLCNGKNGCYINIRKGMGIDELVRPMQEPVNSFNLRDNPVQSLGRSEENVSNFGNLTSISRHRQRQRLRDIFIETYNPDSNVNGQTPRVLATSNEEYRTPTSVLFTNTNEKYPSTYEILSETYNKRSGRNTPKTSTFKYFKQLQNYEYGKNSKSNLNVSYTVCDQFKNNNFIAQSILGNGSKKEQNMTFWKKYPPLDVSLPLLSTDPSLNVPLPRQCFFSDRGNTNVTDWKSVPEDQSFCEYAVKTKYLYPESSSTITKVTILNKVLQSPWHTRQPENYRPVHKKVSNSTYSESNYDIKANVSPKDKNNNSDKQLKANADVCDEVISYKQQTINCNVCQEVFIRRQDYSIHMRKHSSITRYSCSECQKTFSQLRNFKYHMSVHRGTKEYAATCPVCRKHFNDRGYLSNHMKIHRNRKEYKCASCPKSFNQRVAFNMHVRIHTGVKPHVCDKCGKAFSRKMLLKQHQRTHSGERPYACAHCDKRFADRSNMTLHVRLHTGVKPFSCTLCPKSFTKKHHLKSHLNFHTGAKPYSCPRCKLAFTQSSNMRTHFKKCNATN